MKFLSILVLGIVMVAAVSAAPAPVTPPPMQTSFENIKVLTGMADTDIRKEMNNWTEALGVNCNYCHVAGDFAAETNPKKDTARKMATMLKTINTKDFLDGKAQCILCHRGAAVPDPNH